jgi:hypothetical protein
MTTNECRLPSVIRHPSHYASAETYNRSLSSSHKRKTQTTLFASLTVESNDAVATRQTSRPSICFICLLPMMKEDTHRICQPATMSGCDQTIHTSLAQTAAAVAVGAVAAASATATIVGERRGQTPIWGRKRNGFHSVHSTHIPHTNKQSH